MKTTRINKTARLTGITIAVAMFAGLAQAQYKPTGDDGITASPRLRQMLNERNRVPATQPAPSDYKPMSCAKCKDVWVSSVDSFAKPAKVMMSGFKPTVTTAKHLCNGCDTRITVTGLSKATRRNVALHKCSSCGAETLACCNTKKGSEVTTKGMEKKFEVAPLK